jgi:hypothetical protein
MIKFASKIKKGKPSKKDLPYLKTISQVLNSLLKLRIHSRNQRWYRLIKAEPNDPALSTLKASFVSRHHPIRLSHHSD